LLKANRHDETERDFQWLLTSEIGVVLVEEERVAQARQIIHELKGED